MLVLVTVSVGIVMGRVVVDMIELQRICIPVGLDCNYRCKYCIRDINSPPIPTETTELFREYMRSVKPSWCNAVALTGGEPLLYWDTVLEVFGLVDKKVHKKIITNGSLLTQDMVDYINANEIELNISHDAKATREHRGRDILLEPHLLELVKSVDFLSINCVASKHNNDVVENYLYLCEVLGRSDFIYSPFLCLPNGNNQEALEGFDYDLFTRTYISYLMQYNTRNNSPFYTRNIGERRKCDGFNVLLDGSVVSMVTLNRYGDVSMELEELIAVKDAHEDMKFCREHDCRIREDCTMQGQMASEHACSIAKDIIHMSRFFKASKERLRYGE